MKVIFLPLSSMCSAHKKLFCLHWDISKLAERGETQSNHESLHLDVYFIFGKRCILPMMLYQQKQCFRHLPQLKMPISPLGVFPSPPTPLVFFLVFLRVENNIAFSLFLNEAKWIFLLKSLHCFYLAMLSGSFPLVLWPPACPPPAPSFPALGERRPCPGRPLGGLQSSVCHCLCLRLQKGSYCFHTRTQEPPGVMG